MVHNHYLLKLVAILCTILFAIPTASAQWQQVNLFEGGIIYTLERVGNELWAGTNLGIYKSSDEGASWEYTSDFINSKVIKIDSYNDTVNVYYENFETPFQQFSTKVSFDGGETWSNEFVFPESSQINRFYRNNNILYVFEQYYSYFSTDFGLSWNTLTGDSWIGQNIVYYDEIGCIYTDYNNGQDQFYAKSFQTDESILINTTGYSLGSHACRLNDEIYLTAESGQSGGYQIIKTSNYGLNWDTVIVLNDFVSYFTEFTKYEDDIYFFDSFMPQAVKISNNGNTVELINDVPDLILALESGNFTIVDYTTLFNGNFLVSNANSSNTSFRLYSSDLSYISNYGYGINTAHINKFKSEDGKIWISDYRGAYFSEDNMLTWDTIPNVSSIYSTLIIGDTLILTTQFNNTEYLTISHNGGQTWTSNVFPSLIDNSLYSYSSKLTMAELNGVLYLESGHQIVKSNDWGVTWQALPNLASSYNGFPLNSLGKGYLLKVEDNILLGVSGNSLILKLNPTNDSWEYVAGYDYQGYGYIENHYLQMSDTVLFSNSAAHLMYSLNQGVDWISPSMDGIPQVPVFPYDTIYPGFITIDANIWYGTFREFGIYYSLDNGNNWTSLQNPSPFIADGGIEIIDDILYSGSWNGGLWRHSSPLNISSGSVFVDANFNGIKDITENGIPNILVRAFSSNTMVSTNSTGDYQIVTEIENDTIAPIISLGFATILPQQISTSGAQTNNDFAIQLRPFNDLTVGLTALNVFRPGFNTYLQIGSQNLGSTSSPASIKLCLPEDVTLLNSTPNFTSQIGDTIQWVIPNLDVFENYNIQLNVISSVSAPLGDTVNCYVEISPIGTDSIPSNNTFNLQDIYVGSYDPNDKQCVQGSEINIDDLNNDFELHYVIRFQNTGTFEAENIRIEDQLSALLKWETIRIIDQSHYPLHYEINDGGLLNFYFNHIQLADSFANEPASHGFVKYGIKPISQLSLGNVISNTAAIYFDFNDPVITNTALSEIIEVPLSIASQYNDKPVSEFFVIPNPAKNYIKLSANNIELKNKSYFIYDAYGREVIKNAIDSQNPIIQIEQLTPGLYFGVICDQNRTTAARFKFVKQ